MLARLLSGIALLGSFAVSLSGQTVPVPWINVQFTDQSGRPLSGGKVYTCVAGTSCPGTTRLTYTNSSGSTANSNPVTLDANGRAAIWLTANVAYKFVVTNIIGTVIAGAGGDNITGGSGGGGGGGSSPWTTSGANIYNSNAGNVGIGTSSPGYQLEVGGNTQIDGVLRIRNSDLTPHAVNITSQSGMAGDYFLSLPLALPGATSCLQVNTAGFMSYLAGCASGGGGGGAGNGSFPFSASTGFTITHNLNSTDILVDCYDDGTPELLIALTATYPKLTANTAVVAWTGSKSGHCVVNSSAGNPNIWSRDGDDNITLTDSLTAVSALKFLNQTASTGATNVVIQAGAGQAVGGILSFKDNGGATQAYVDGTSFGFLSSQFADIGGVFEVSSFGGLRLSSAKGIMWSSDGTFFGTPDLGLNRNAAGILEINSGTPGTFRDLHLRNLIIDGTCTGSACGGGGSSAPFSDAGPLIKNNADNTKQERISLVNVPTSTTGVLTVKAAATYVLPGENIANTWTGTNTFSNTTTLQSDLIWQQGGLTRFAVNTGGSGATWDFNRYDNSGMLAGVPFSINRSTGVMTASSNILPNGSVTLGSIASPWTSVVSTTMTASSAFNLYNGVAVAYSIGMSSGNLAIVDQLSAPMVVAQPTPKTWTWYGDMYPSVTGKVLGSNSLQWDGVFRNITINGTCTGCVSGGANTSLSNLGATALNADILPASDNVRNIGSSTLRFQIMESQFFNARSSPGGNQRCFMVGGELGCVNSGGSLVASMDSSTGAINANGGYSVNGSVGITAFPVMRNAAGAACIITIILGIITGTTC